MVKTVPGVSFDATVARVSPVVDSATGTFKITIEISDPSRRLKPGMFGRIDIVYDSRQMVLQIPRSAIVEEAGNAALSNALSINDKLPFAAAAAVAWKLSPEPERRRTLLTAQIEHGLIRDAIAAGESARAEALMKEHAHVAMESVRAIAKHQAEDETAEMTYSILQAS